MPLALSATGPNTSIEIVLPVSVSMPMPVMATPKATNVGVVPAYTNALARIAAAIISTAATVLS